VNASSSANTPGAAELFVTVIVYSISYLSVPSTCTGADALLETEMFGPGTSTQSDALAVFPLNVTVAVLNVPSPSHVPLPQSLWLASRSSSGVVAGTVKVTFTQ